MDLKLTEQVRNTFFISKKPGEILIFGTFSAKKKINFGLYFVENRHFRSAMFYYVIVTSYDFHDFVSTERRDPSLPYTTVSNNYTLGVSIPNSQGGGTHPLTPC